MRLTRTRIALLVAALGIAAGVLAFSLLGGMAVPQATELKPFVRARPTLPVVFTSRTTPASFEAAAPEGEGFTYPGTIPWAADEGRLRRLDPDGRVYELTWGRELPGGGTLVDVMSPTVSIDGKRILFAGRRAAPDPGRWRVYEMNIDGSGLRQRTGLPGDPGCVAVPPLRFAADGSKMADAERSRLDYDDVDPADDGLGGFVFASSRLPDLGRGHSRRPTQVWLWKKGAPAPRALTANRNNDRWPVAANDDLFVFSMWSRNREAVSLDRTEIVPVEPGKDYATDPTDLWQAARVQAGSTQFGYAVKAAEPVWRPRNLFDGRLAYMTAGASAGEFRLAQADWGYLRVAPSSLAAGGKMPAQVGDGRQFGPDRDAEGRPLSAGCPSPMPANRVLFAARPLDRPAGGYGLYHASDDWSVPAAAELLFDDPRLVDAEPVAIYARGITAAESLPPSSSRGPHSPPVVLADGKVYTGEAGALNNTIISGPMPDLFPAQRTDAGTGPVVPPPPGVESIVFYAAGRDRFDDPARPRLPGRWEKLLTAKLDKRGFLDTWLPADPLSPTVLAGLGNDGKVVTWTGAADSKGTAATFYAVAGDHYSGTRANGYHFCLWLAPHFMYQSV